MTKDKVIEIALKAGFERNSLGWSFTYGKLDYHLGIFADLIEAESAAAEREECAKVCDEKVNAEYATGKVDHNEMGWTQACAISIRARGRE